MKIVSGGTGNTLMGFCKCTKEFINVFYVLNSTANQINIPRHWNKCLHCLCHLFICPNISLITFITHEYCTSFHSANVIWFYDFHSFQSLFGYPSFHLKCYSQCTVPEIYFAGSSCHLAKISLVVPKQEATAASCPQKPRKMTKKVVQEETVSVDAAKELGCCFSFTFQDEQRTAAKVFLRSKDFHFYSWLDLLRF